MQVVLERGSGDEKPFASVEEAHSLTKLRVFILDAMSLINDQVLPCKLLEG